jgi:hypothetical protein
MDPAARQEPTVRKAMLNSIPTLLQAILLILPVALGVTSPSEIGSDISILTHNDLYGEATQHGASLTRQVTLLGGPTGCWCSTRRSTVRGQRKHVAHLGRRCGRRGKVISCHTSRIKARSGSTEGAHVSTRMGSRSGRHAPDPLRRCVPARRRCPTRHTRTTRRSGKCG